MYCTFLILEKKKTIIGKDMRNNHFLGCVFLYCTIFITNFFILFLSHGCLAFKLHLIHLKKIEKLKLINHKSTLKYMEIAHLHKRYKSKRDAISSFLLLACIQKKTFWVHPNMGHNSNFFSNFSRNCFVE